MKALALAAGMLLTGTGLAWAGDGTKTSPYTVAELNAQKDALAASGNTVWVKADLKGLGEDGTKTDNATADNVKQMAGLFGDATGTFVAYSWQILGELSLSDLTNTKDLLIALTYGTSGHKYGNLQNEQYAEDYEPQTAHFSLAEVHNALSLTIGEAGLRGYHVQSCYIVPEKMIAVKVNAGYSTSNGAYVSYTNFDGAGETAYTTPKNCALVLMAAPGTYDFVLGTSLYDQTMSNGNGMNPGTQAGVNAGTTKNRTRLRFVADGTKAGFERNSDENCTVTLQSSDEIFLQVSSLATNFYGNYAWETEAKDWITWAGGKYSDFHAVTGPDATFDFAANPNNWPVSTEVFGDEADAAKVTVLTVGGVKLTSIQNNEYNANFIYKNGDAAPAFRVFRDNAFMLTAPEGKAIIKVVATMAANNFDLTATTGAVADNVWTGNASEVTFTTAATRLISKLEVTLADENSETVKPAAIDAEAADFAAFNAAEDGKTVKLTLTNAKVNGVKNGDYYVEDASGATVIKGLTLTAGTALNGYVIGKKSTDSNIDYMGLTPAPFEPQLTATDASTFEATATTLTGKVMTIPAASAQANYGKLVTLENLAVSGSNKNNMTLKDADDNTIKARGDLFVMGDDFTWPSNLKKITGVLVYYMTSWAILPISADAIVAAGAQPTSATFDFTSEAIRENIGTAMGDTKGYIYNETFTAENVTLQITGGSAPSRIYKDANRGQNLVTYTQYATLTFKAPAGYAVTKIEFTAAGSSNISKLTPSSGAVDGMTWAGNAEGVRFTQGGTSYLAKAVVTLAAKDESTAALPALEYTECANIAAFNALEAGTYAKVTLTDAEITGKSADGYTTVFVQDATGGCWIQYTTLNDKLQEKTKVNGVVYVVKRLTSGNPQMKEAEDTPKSELTATELSDYTVVEGTLAEVNVAANLNKVVKLTGATLEETSASAGKLTQGDATIDVNNGTATANQQLHKVAEWAPGTKLTDVTMVAILVAKSATANQLLPISMTGTASGIETVAADVNADDVQIYNLQGVRLNSLQRGVNIVNGKKVVIK